MNEDMIFQEMKNKIDDKIKKTLLSEFPQRNATLEKTDLTGFTDELIDRLTTVILCNPSDFANIKRATDNATGFYKVVKYPHTEAGQAFIVEDEVLKKCILERERNRTR